MSTAPRGAAIPLTPSQKARARHAREREKLAAAGYDYRTITVTKRRKVLAAIEAAALKLRRDKQAHIKRLHHVQLRRAMPPWADVEAIRAIYDEARRLTTETGIPHEVDHEIPLLGRGVTGLHVEWNLRVVTRTENRRKSNRL